MQSDSSVLSGGSDEESKSEGDIIEEK